MSSKYLTLDEIILKLQLIQQQGGYGDEPVYFADSSGYTYNVERVVVDTDHSILIE